MIPILYEKNEEEFKDNGIGRLADAITCKVTEERNGEYELSMTYPVNSELFSEIQNDRVILAVPFKDGKPQAFDIYQVNPALGGKVQIYAHHVSYRANFIPVKPFQTHDRPGIDTAIERLQNNILFEDTPFTVSTTITNTTTPFQLLIPQSLRACLGGTQGSLLDTYSGQGTGEFEWDNFHVILHAHRGADRGEYIRYGKNMQSLDRELDSADVATGVIVYWQAEDSPACYFSDIAWNESLRGLFGDKVSCIDITSEFEMAPPKTSLNEVAAEKAAKLDPIKDEVEVEFYDEDDMDVRLCDTVHVIYKRFGIVKDMDVIKTVWDVLNDKYEKITLGKKKSSLSDTLYNAQIESKEYTNSKMISVTQYVDRENGIIHDQIQAITGTRGNYLALISPLYLMNNGSEPRESDEWSEIFPGWESGKTIWVKYATYYDGGIDPQEIGPFAISNSYLPADGALTQYYVGEETDPSDIPQSANWGYDMPAVPPGYHLWIRTELLHSVEGQPAPSDFTSPPVTAENKLYESTIRDGSTVIQTEEEITSLLSRVETITQGGALGWVNRSPFFSYPFDDSEAYWKSLSYTADGFKIERLTDGWARVTSTNHSGTMYFCPVPDANLNADNLTMLIEIQNAVYNSGLCTICLSNTTSAQYTHSDMESNLADDVYRLKINKTNVVDLTYLIETRFNCQAFTGSFDIRISLYKEDYEGEYIPYIVNGSDFSAYATGLRTITSQTNTGISTINGQIDIINENIDSIRDEYLDIDGAPTLINEFITKSEASIKSDLNEVKISVGEIQQHSNALGEQYREEIGTHFAFTQNGLDIYPYGSDVDSVAHLDSDSIDFSDKYGNTYAWLDSDEGIGGRKVSLGDPEDRSKRWMIKTTDGGGRLAFFRCQ